MSIAQESLLVTTSFRNEAVQRECGLRSSLPTTLLTGEQSLGLQQQQIKTLLTIDQTILRCRTKSPALDNTYKTLRITRRYCG